MGNIDVHSIEGDVNQLEAIKAQADIEITAANVVTLSGEAVANNINITGAGELVLESSLNAQENIALREWQY